MHPSDMLFSGLSYFTPGRGLHPTSLPRNAGMTGSYELRETTNYTAA